MTYLYKLRQELENKIWEEYMSKDKKYETDDERHGIGAHGITPPIDLEQPIESEVKRQEVDKTRKVLLVHRRGMDVVANENTRANPDMLEIRLLNGKGVMTIRRAKKDEFVFEGFLVEVRRKDDSLMQSYFIADDNLEGKEMTPEYLAEKLGGKP